VFLAEIDGAVSWAKLEALIAALPKAGKSRQPRRVLSPYHCGRQ
jgi:hypothetical protein